MTDIRPQLCRLARLSVVASGERCPQYRGQRRQRPDTRGATKHSMGATAARPTPTHRIANEPSQRRSVNRGPRSSPPVVIALVAACWWSAAATPGLVDVIIDDSANGAPCPLKLEHGASALTACVQYSEGGPILLGPHEPWGVDQ